MGGQAAEQIIAGVVLSERLAVTMYGAIHRAQFNGARNLRGLIVDPKMLAEDAFRKALTDEKNVSRITQLEHGHIVPTVGVEAGGPDVVVVTRGVGRYVTVQDLLTAAKAGSRPGSKLAPPVAAAIGVAVIEALAKAHGAGIVHGAVHPRSVLIDEDGVVRLTDFVVGRALTTAVAQGAESALWRGLTGYIAPELVVGEDPTPAADVFATGAMLFTMLTGEAPPGVLRVTPAIERLVSRALDTDLARRYRSAADLLENLQEALEDDRWELADRGELIREAGLSSSDSNVDEATEDLLASLGSSDRLQSLPIRPSVGLRAEAAAAKGASGPASIDALLADLDDDGTGMTTIDEPPRRADPISEIIKRDPRERELLVSATRVPSLDDPDDDPPPRRISEHDRTRRSSPAMRAVSADEQAALAAIGDLDEGAKRVNTAAEQAAAAAAKLEEAAQRAERAAARVETGPNALASAPAARTAAPIVDPIRDLDVPPVKLKSPVRGVIGGVLVLGVIGAAAYGIHWRFQQDKQEAHLAQQIDEQKKQHAAEETAQALAAQPDPGAIEIDAPDDGIWLKLGTTPLVTSIDLPANQQHDMILLRDGFAPTPAQVNGTTWTGEKATLKATLDVQLKPAHGKAPPELPLQPTTPVLGTTGIVGKGPVHVDSTPPGAEVWLFIGGGHARFDNLTAGRDYEVAVVRPGYKTKHVEFKADDWRDNDPSTPIDAAKKKAVLSASVELEPEGSPAHRPGKGS